MLVVLEAFGGKLRSDFMEWPDEAHRPEIHLMLNMDNLEVVNEYGDFSMTPNNKMPKLPCRGRFIDTNRFYISGKESARIYVLVEII